MATEIDHNLTLQDRIRLLLNEYGAKYVPYSIDDLCGRLGEQYYNVYQALYRLSKLNEIELEKDIPADGGKAKIIGINIIKLEPSERTYKRAANKAKVNIEDIDVDVQEQMTALTGYLRQKMAILDMQDQAKKAGLDPETTVQFEVNPVAEEGLLLLKKLSEVSTQLQEKSRLLQEVTYDLEAERRNVAYYKGKVKEETRSGLLEFAHAG